MYINYYLYLFTILLLLVVIFRKETNELTDTFTNTDTDKRS